jgi:hypothetical protein
LRLAEFIDHAINARLTPGVVLVIVMMQTHTETLPGRTWLVCPDLNSGPQERQRSTRSPVMPIPRYPV